MPAPPTVTTQLTAPAPVAASAPVRACSHCRIPQHANTWNVVLIYWSRVSVLTILPNGVIPYWRMHALMDSHAGVMCLGLAELCICKVAVV